MQSETSARVVTAPPTGEIEPMLRRPEVRRVTGLSDSALYRLMLIGDFPRPVKLTARSVAWPASAVARWVASRIAGKGVKA